MQYSEKLKTVVYAEYSNFTPCIQALENGSYILGRFLCDSIPSRIERKNLSGDALNLDILEQVQRIWRREDIYRMWQKEIDNKEAQ